MISITRYRVWPDGDVQEADTPAHHWKSDDYELVEALNTEDAWARAKANAPAVPQGRKVWLLVRGDDESDAVMMYFEKPVDSEFKDRYKLREFVLVEPSATPAAPSQSAASNDCMHISGDDCLFDVDEPAHKRLLEERGGCRCHIAPPCSACTEPFTEQELNSVGYTYTPAPAPAVPQGVPEINYPALIEAAVAKNRKFVPGTTGCIAFALGAEWFRELMLAATPAPAPAQEVPSDPNGWCQYVAGMVFGWLQMQEGLGLTSYDEDRFVEAIAGIIRRRLWAYKPAQEVGLTDEEIEDVFEQHKGTAGKELRATIGRAIIAALRAKGGK